MQFLDGNTVGSYAAVMSLYFGGDGTSDSAKATMNPYDYGFPIEVKVGANGIATVEKRYAMGRSANELSYVIPDQKTAYITDDNTLIIGEDTGSGHQNDAIWRVDQAPRTEGRCTG